MVLLQMLLVGGQLEIHLRRLTATAVKCLRYRGKMYTAWQVVLGP